MDMRALRRTIDWRRQMALAHEDTARKLRPAALRSSCPACDGTAHTPFVEIYGFVYHECGACGHLFLANGQEETHFQVAGKVGYPFFGELVLDCLERTERAMTQEHAFKAAELSVRAQMQAVDLVPRG